MPAAARTAGWKATSRTPATAAGAAVNCRMRSTIEAHAGQRPALPSVDPRHAWILLNACDCWWSPGRCRRPGSSTARLQDRW
ncbi:hypothetical protein G6F23_015943 [Rhizopus arrhizus]|nr:hypothetical protein G6F23_015943 [Rhizopus arrhizus]